MHGAEVRSQNFERTVAELAAFQKSEVEKWARVVKAGNIKVD